eukprot:CAMPEP_0182901422 /NCGR_PEP_ID=MMETSP0034_2-20130328/29641_1 /TAXON_ID=156128 /ORGANISM="Nephroselmis pyriformis, Strain CCMP717" /LENGTH=144 /DNA_ID=CAMNT_0025035835 /DNA_START=303 /DNA_END=733 /DNA_ORIENTATION=+
MERLKKGTSVSALDAENIDSASSGGDNLTLKALDSMQTILESIALPALPDMSALDTSTYSSGGSANTSRASFYTPPSTAPPRAAAVTHSQASAPRRTAVVDRSSGDTPETVKMQVMRRERQRLELDRKELKERCARLEVDGDVA